MTLIKSGRCSLGHYLGHYLLPSSQLWHCTAGFFAEALALRLLLVNVTIVTKAQRLYQILGKIVSYRYLGKIDQMGLIVAFLRREERRKLRTFFGARMMDGLWAK